ncbi:hypothetical protein DL240_17420 [Lujinxingia litoralis]|uniref:Uncharacterized protein n=1 Tax=Lujinxingia litoralis TaxID=2211119 RepID=A0A328C3H2_9DELT|nr:hypothetical protein DL240_17420 [Lujinxingia litoralis]
MTSQTTTHRGRVEMEMMQQKSLDQVMVMVMVMVMVTEREKGPETSALRTETPFCWAAGGSRIEL